MIKANKKFKRFQFNLNKDEKLIGLKIQTKRELDSIPPFNIYASTKTKYAEYKHEWSVLGLDKQDTVLVIESDQLKNLNEIFFTIEVDHSLLKNNQEKPIYFQIQVQKISQYDISPGNHGKLNVIQNSNFLFNVHFVEAKNFINSPIFYDLYLRDCYDTDLLDLAWDENEVVQSTQHSPISFVLNEEQKCVLVTLKAKHSDSDSNLNSETWYSTVHVLKASSSNDSDTSDDGKDGFLWFGVPFLVIFLLFALIGLIVHFKE